MATKLAMFAAVLFAAGMIVWLLREPGEPLRSDTIPHRSQPAVSPPAPAEPTGSPQPRDAAAVFDQIDAAEERLLALSAGPVRALSRSLLELRMPDERARQHFAGQLVVRPVDFEHARRDAVCSGEERERFEATEPAADAIPRDEVQIWQPLLSRFDWFEHAKIYLIEGHFAEGDDGRYLSKAGLTGVGRLGDGRRAQLSGHLDLEWEERDGAWQVVRWEDQDLELVIRPGPAFREVAAQVLDDPAVREEALRNHHEEMITRLILAETPEQKKASQKDALKRLAELGDDVPGLYMRYDELQAADFHPGVSVVDVDADGLDDLYLMRRLGTNLLLRNRGDGSFEDVTKSHGLDVQNHSSSALFADFDNDGDPDVFIGRTLRPSMYLENQDGRFVDRSRSFAPFVLPAMVSAVSAADVDADGLLDVYFSTFAYAPIKRDLARLAVDEPVLPNFLIEAEGVELGRRARQLTPAEQITDSVGPRNVFLHNLGGGRFARPAPESPFATLEVWRNTNQAGFADYDGDGDPDLYLSNDFAPNNFLENRGEEGFVDVTERTGTADIGFGMGVSFGDYDADGKQDLYVTNMFSKAGRRITRSAASAGGMRFAPMAMGNSLFHNRGERFEKVSGTKPPALLVEKGGWGWGGQFVDVDNDGDLDLHAAAGYYTAPAPVRSEADT
jgi:hypothetical protein